MPVTLTQIADNSATVVIKFKTGDEVNDLHIEYYPNHLTEEAFAQLKQFENLDKDVLGAFKSLNEVLVMLVKSWDLYPANDNEHPVPITAESLKQLPVYFKASILYGIMEDLSPKEIAPQRTRS